MTTCPDYGVDPGLRHRSGCDVTRCAGCGAQLLGGCDCPDEFAVPTIWTGLWPGVVEVSEGLATDLSDLALKGGLRKLRWTGQRWRPLGDFEAGDTLSYESVIVMEPAIFADRPRHLGRIVTWTRDERGVWHCDDGRPMTATDDEVRREAPWRA